MVNVNCVSIPISLQSFWYGTAISAGVQRRNWRTVHCMWLKLVGADRVACIMMVCPASCALE